VIALTVQELRALTPLLKRLSDRASRPISINQLLSRWSTFIEQIDRGYRLTGYDYVNDLATRDFLDEILSAAPKTLRERITNDELEALDARFRDASRELPTPLRIATPERPKWWWYRIPNDLSGELASDLVAG
jgi:hypothetical protein